MEYKADASDPKFVDAMFTHLDMTCWTDEKISGIVQYFFIGWALSCCLVWVPDSIGRVKMFKKILIPVNITIFTLFFLTKNYKVQCIVFFILGIIKMKSNVTILTVLEHLPASHQGLSAAVIYGLEGLTVGLFCFYI